MRKRISKVAPVQLGKVFAILYALASIPIALFMLLAGSLGGASGMPMWMVLAIPVVYLVFGFVFTLIAAWLYNLVAGWVGGVEYTTEDVSEA